MLEGLDKPVFDKLERNSKFQNSPDDNKKEKANGQDTSILLSHCVNNQHH
jgi:hypothetical protein